MSVKETAPAHIEKENKMAYMENYAPKREDPNTDRVEVAPALAVDSNQSRTAGQASKFRTVEVTTDKYNAGSVVRLQANDKGTGVVGRPSSLGNKGRDFIKPATANPSGTGNIPGKPGTQN